MGTLICLLCKSRMLPDDGVDIIASEVGLFLGRKCLCGNLLVRASSSIKTFGEAIQLQQVYLGLNEVLNQRR